MINSFWIHPMGFLRGNSAFTETLKHHRKYHLPIFLHDPRRMWFRSHSTPGWLFNTVNIIIDHMHNNIIYYMVGIQKVQQRNIKRPYNSSIWVRSFGIYSYPWFSVFLCLWKIKTVRKLRQKHTLTGERHYLSVYLTALSKPSRLLQPALCPQLCRLPVLEESSLGYYCFLHGNPSFFDLLCLFSIYFSR